MAKNLSNISNIRAILFDVDGVLVDSGEAHIYSIRETLSEMEINKKLEDREILETIGSSIEDIFKRLVGMDEVKNDFIQVFRRKMYEEGGVEYLKPYPLVNESLRGLRDMGIRMAVVTNKRLDTTNLFLRKAAIDCSVFEFVISSQDVKRYKPAPDSVLLAIERLNLSPSNVALVGDTILDIQAAKDSRVMSIAVKCGFGKDLQGADVLIESVKDLPRLLKRYKQSSEDSY